MIDRSKADVKDSERNSAEASKADRNRGTNNSEKPEK